MTPILKRFSRPTVALAHDLVMAALSLPLSIGLRVGGDLFDYAFETLALWTGLFTLAAAGVFLATGTYRGVWRYASVNDMTAILRAVTLTILVFLPVAFLVSRLDELPRSLIVINWFVLTALLAGPRIGYRLLKEGRLAARRGAEAERRVPVLLAGAGDAADTFIRAMDRGRSAQYRVVGLLDEGGGRIGRNIRGVDVLGGLEDLEAVVARLDRSGRRPQRIIVTKSEIKGPRLRRLAEEADRLGITLARLPRLTDFRAAEGGRVETQPIAIEDLLGRPQTVLDRDPVKALIEGRRIMVTGAGGTIGGELVRQIAELAPARLVLVENSEFNLYQADLELGERAPGLARRAALADVRQRQRIADLIGDERPDVVFHAAALKHVPLCEAHPAEAALTNAVGTRNVADACRSAGVQAMVLISTDKAVNPSSVMGASKRLAESYCQALDVLARQGRGATRFATVRFGNVLGSTGSVVPLFQRQLAAGGPLTVTHPDMTRYFMTVREAVELVLQASALGAADDPAWGGRIMVLDMGEPVRIVDLARQMIRLAGLQPDREVKIAFTGLRPGEKLAEELFHSAEALEPTVVKGVRFAAPRTADLAFLVRAMDELETAAASGRGEAVAGLLRRFVPEYSAATPARSGAERAN